MSGFYRSVVVGSLLRRRPPGLTLNLRCEPNIYSKWHMPASCAFWTVVRIVERSDRWYLLAGIDQDGAGRVGWFFDDGLHDRDDDPLFEVIDDPARVQSGPGPC